MIEILGYSALIAIVWFLGGVLIIVVSDRRLKGGLEAIAVIVALLSGWSALSLVCLLLTIGYIIGSA